MNRHRKIKRNKAVAAVGTMSLAGAAVLSSAHSSEAAPVSTWDKVASCESSGDWHINTGNGYYGGLQFTAETWAAYGGKTYANQADRATKDQQIIVAERVLASQGPGAWPVCGVKAGLSRSDAASGQSADRQSVASKKITISAAAKAVGFARAQIGKPYVYGASGPRSYDCSGLTSAAWRAAGVSIPRTSQAQWRGLPRVPVSQVRPGDIVVYYSGASHVALAIGGGKVIEAPRPGARVRVAKLHAQPVLGVVRPHGRTTSAVSKTTATEHGEPEGIPARSHSVAFTHTVVPGDTLYHISRLYAVPGGWPALFQANLDRIRDAHWIFPGQVLVIPR